MLEYFNVYSSVAGLMGSPGQAPHSSANAWLNAMADCRRRLGVNGQSVAWGAVAEIGYAARHGADKRADVAGSGAISRVVALRSQFSLLATSRSFTVMPAEFSRLLAGTTEARSFLAYAHLRARGRVAEKPKPTPKQRPTLEKKAVVSLETVLELAQKTAGADVDADAPLMDAGVDSLGAVELRNQLQAAAGSSQSLPSTLVFDHPTARQIASLFIVEECVPAMHARVARSSVSLETVLELAQKTAGADVDADAPLMDAGVDSLGAVELRNQLQAAAGSSQSLPSTLVFDHPTARQIASLFIVEECVPAMHARVARSSVSLETVLELGSEDGWCRRGCRRAADGCWRRLAGRGRAAQSAAGRRWVEPVAAQHAGV